MNEPVSDEEIKVAFDRAVGCILWICALLLLIGGPIVVVGCGFDFATGCVWDY